MSASITERVYSSITQISVLHVLNFMICVLMCYTFSILPFPECNYSGFIPTRTCSGVVKLALVTSDRTVHVEEGRQLTIILATVLVLPAIATFVDVNARSYSVADKLSIYTINDGR